MTNLDFAPTTLDLLNLRGGDDESIDMKLSQDGIPLDTTGGVVTAQIRKTAISEEIAVSAQVTIEDASIGHYTILFQGADLTAALDGKASFSGVWDVQLVLAGTTSTLLAGSANILSDVTRP